MKRNKELLYVDMDDVLCNYSEAFEMQHSETNKFPQSKWGFFATLEPVDLAIPTVKKLMFHYDVWVLTRPSYVNALCYTEKRLWIEKYFGVEFCKKLILCTDKSLLKGDYLIDDSIDDGQLDFEGELIHFGSQDFKDWNAVKTYLIKK